jgi:phenylacetate-CoA ligase
MLTPTETLIYSGLSLVAGKNLLCMSRAVRERILWSRCESLTFRFNRLRSLLAHAATNVPYYRDGFGAAGFTLNQLNSFADLEKLPVLTRDELIDSFTQLQDERAHAAEHVFVRTGGTSGKPVHVLQEKRNWVERMLVNHRMYATMGRSLGTRTLILAGSPIDCKTLNSIGDKLKARIFNTRVRSSFGLTAEGIRELITELSSGHYQFVIAYASVFDVLANESDRQRSRLKLSHIVPCAELVTLAQRERWQAALGAEIFEIYGSREMASIAGETPDHCGMLVNADLYHVEITDDQGRNVPLGTPGIITITSLIERGMPLIRYQLGDIGALCEDPGDRYSFPRLRITHGRELDLIYCPDGKVLPGEFFPHLMKEVSGKVERFQVVQEELDRLIVYIVRREGYTDETTRYLTGKIQEQVGPDMHVEATFVENIAPSVSGKYRPTMCKLPEESRRSHWRPDRRRDSSRGDPVEGSV